MYENTVVHNDQSGATVPATDQRLLDGNELTLVTVDGNLSESGVTSRTVDVEPTSAASNVVRLRNDTSNVSVTVPTRLSESAWRDLLAGELADGHLLGIDYADGPGEFSLLTLRLEPGVTYRLRMAEVAVGTGASEPEPTYLRKQRGDGATVTENTGQTLTVEVRDEYDNPAESGTVNVTLDGPGSLNAPGEPTLTNVSVGEDGEVELDYEAPENVNSATQARIKVSLGNASTVDPDAPEETQFELKLADTDTGVGGGGTADYSETQNQTISTDGGLWTNITGANATRLLNARFSPINPSQGAPSQNNRYFRLAFVLNNSTTEYTFVVGHKKSGLRYKQQATDRSWAERGVTLYKFEEGSGTSKLFEDEALTVSDLENWLDGDRLELLEPLSYQNPDKTRGGLTEVRRFLMNANASDPAQAFITDMTGRTGMRILNTSSDNVDYLAIDQGNVNTKPTAIEDTGGGGGDGVYAALRFGLINQQPGNRIDEVRAVNFTVVGRSTNAVDNSRSGSGEYKDQFYFSGDSTDGIIDQSFSTGTDAQLTQTGDIAADTGVVVYVNEFRDAEGSPVDLQVGDTIRLTVEYGIDGETYRQTLEFDIDQREQN
ncbi:MAG: hypothetical protein ABEJ79_04980 [Halolamina sp.]